MSSSSPQQQDHNRVNFVILYCEISFTHVSGSVYTELLDITKHNYNFANNLSLVTFENHCDLSAFTLFYFIN